MIPLSRIPVKGYDTESTNQPMIPSVPAFSASSVTSVVKKEFFDFLRKEVEH